LFVGGTGIVVEKTTDRLKARIYPVVQRASTVFYDKDGETKSSFSIENPDWSAPVVVDQSDGGRQINVRIVRFAFEFDLIPGHNYVIK